MPNAKPDKPLNRKEQYLNRISGDNTQELPTEDLNREEQYLRAIVDHVGAIEEATDGLGERITTLEESDKEQSLQIENLQSEVTTATETAEAAKAAADEAKEEASKTGINLLIGTNRGADNWLSANSDVQGVSYANTYGSLPYQTMKATSTKNEAPVLRFTVNSELAKQMLKPSTKYTLSMEFSCAVGIVPSAEVGACIGLFNPEDNLARAWTDYAQSGTIMWTAEFQKIHLTLTTTEEFADLQQPYLWIVVKAAMTKGDAIEIRNLSLVEGEGGYRDWQPNPYEVPELAAQIDAVDVDVSGIHDSIQGIDESISSLEQSVADIQTETAGIGKITENGANIVSNLVESWEQGTVDNTLRGDPYDVSKIDSAARIRVAKPFRTNHPFTVSVSNPDYEFTVLAYNDADLFQMNLTDDYVPGKKYFDTDYAKIAIVVKRADEASAITPENILDVGLKVQLGNVDLPIYTPPTVDINANAEAIAKLQAATPSAPIINSGSNFSGQLANTTGSPFEEDSESAIAHIADWVQVIQPDSGLVTVQILLYNWSFCNYPISSLEKLKFTVPESFYKPTKGAVTVLMPANILMHIGTDGSVGFRSPIVPDFDNSLPKRIDGYGFGMFTFSYVVDPIKGG